MNTELLILFFLLVLILFILFKIKSTNFKNIVLKFLKKHDQTYINLTNTFDLLINFQITLGLMKLNGCVALLNILHINLQLCHNRCQWANINSIQSILYQMQKIWFNVKNPWKHSFRGSRRVSFSYFPNTTLNHTGSPSILSIFLLKGYLCYKIITSQKILFVPFLRKSVF